MAGFFTHAQKFSRLLNKFKSLSFCDVVCDIFDRIFSLIFQKGTQTFARFIEYRIQNHLFYGGEHLEAKICRFDPDFFFGKMNGDLWLYLMVRT